MDRPILFSASMVRAILDDRKTQTRRIIGQYDIYNDSEGKPLPISCMQVEGELLPRVTIGRLITEKNLKAAIGDRLWVREAFRGDKGYDKYPPRTWSHWPVHYEADGTPNATDGIGENGRLRPGIHMPRWASRITLLVRNVRVERLQDISEDDAVAEGCFKGKASGRVFESAVAMHLGGDQWRNARDWFADLWDTINGEGAWDANPYVAAYSFEVIKTNIDQVAQ